jgi:hypothetical protein
MQVTKHIINKMYITYNFCTEHSLWYINYIYILIFLFIFKNILNIFVYSLFSRSRMTVWLCSTFGAEPSSQVHYDYK